MKILKTIGALAIVFLLSISCAQEKKENIEITEDFVQTNKGEEVKQKTLNIVADAENKEKLVTLLTYHVVSGKLDALVVVDAIKENDSLSSVTTVQGENITMSLEDGKVMLKDGKVGIASVDIADVPSSNSIIHAIESVIMHK